MLFCRYILLSLNLFLSLHSLALEPSSWELNELGVRNSENGNFREAIIYYNKALSELPEKGGQEALLKAQILANLGNAFNNLEQYKIAIEYLSDAIDLRITVIENPKIENDSNLWKQQAFDKYQLGYAYSGVDSEGATDDAIRSFEDSLKIHLSIYSKDDIELFKVHRSLHYLYQKSDLYEKALFHAKRQLAISQIHYRFDSSLIAQSHDELGYIYYLNSSYEKAAEHFESALRLNEEVNELDPHQYLHQYELLADIYTFNGTVSVDRAIELLEKALTISVKEHNQSNEKAAELYLQLALAKAVKCELNFNEERHLYGISTSRFYSNQFSNALSDANKSLLILKDLYGENYEKVAKAHEDMSKIYSYHWDGKDEQEIHLKKALGIYSILFGEKA